MATTKPKPENPLGLDLGPYEEAAQRIRELNERLIESSKAAGITTLDAYEKALKSLVDFEEKVAGASQLEWVSALAQTHAPSSATSAPPTPRPRASCSAELLGCSGRHRPAALARPTAVTRSAGIRTGVAPETGCSRQTARRVHGPQAAIVTGAASGIGAAVAARLVKDGVDRRSASILAPAGRTAPGVPFAADLTTREGNRAAVDAALERFGRLDIVVPNAGFQHVVARRRLPRGPLGRAAGHPAHQPVPAGQVRAGRTRAQSGEGRFVVVASAHALAASPFKAGYVSAKHGVLGLVKTLALEGADVGITRRAVCPGYVRTPLVEKQIADQAEAHGMPEDEVLEEVILAPQAVKRLVEPEEVAEMVAFLLGPSGAP